MGYKKTILSKLKYVTFVVALVSLVLFQVVMTLSDDSKHIESYIEWLNQNISRLIEVSVNNKFQIAKMLYNQNIDDQVAEYLGMAIVEGGQTKEDIRLDFLDRFEPLYYETMKIGLRQFQFHLPNTESFLRLHQPDRYGDLLIDIRQTVNAVIRERKAIGGLEEGRFLNGYRYVFPIFKGQQLVGTVEFSYSYYSIVKSVLDTYHLEAVFVMEKEEVERKGFEDVEKIYQKDVLYELGYIDRDFSIAGMSERLKLSDEEFDVLNAKISGTIRNKRYDTNGFEYVLSDDQLVWAMPLAIQDFTGKPVGTLVFYKNDKVLYELFGYQKNQMTYMYVTSAIVMLLIGLSIYFYMRIKIKATSDSLTKLYNRHYYMDNVVEKGVSDLKDNYDEAVKEADQALYYVKKHSKNAVKIYSDKQ